MDSTPTLATAPLRSTSLRSPSLRRAVAKVAGDGRPLIFLFNMLIILLALHSNSDYEECLSYVGTEGDSKPVEKVSAVSAAQIEPLALYLLDAKRDIADDLRTRSSFWNKMVEEHGLSPDDVKRIEDDLSEINKDIVESSEVLTHIQSHLKNF